MQRGYCACDGGFMRPQKLAVARWIVKGKRARKPASAAGALLVAAWVKAIRRTDSVSVRPNSEVLIMATTKYVTVQVWVVLDERGDYECGADLDVARDRYEESAGGDVADLGIRHVKLVVKVPLPETIKLVGTAGDAGDAGATLQVV